MSGQEWNAKREGRKREGGEMGDEQVAMNKKG